MGNDIVPSLDVDLIQLPNQRRLERDSRYGYLKVVPRPTDVELADYYKSTYRPPVRPHDVEGRVDPICSLHGTTGRVLDIGCGAGELLEEMIRRGWEATGLEPSQVDAELARRRGINVVNRELSWEVAEELGRFDAVILTHVLEHVPRPEEVLAISHHLLQPGGILFCEVPNDFNPLQVAAIKVLGLRQWWISLPDHLNYFNVESLCAIIRGSGFEIDLVTSDFPMEMFLLMGEIYIDNPDAGRNANQKRCRFEEVMRESGHAHLLSQFYAKLAEIGIGRQAIVYARKP